MCKEKSSTPSQKAKGAALGRRIVLDKEAHEYLRKAALAATIACDANGGSAFVSGFTKDDVLGKRARDLLARK
jgi:hypothetical protein